MYTTSAVVTQFSANTKKQQKQTAKEIIAANGQALSFQFMTEAKRRSFLLLTGNLMRVCEPRGYRFCRREVWASFH